MTRRDLAKGAASALVAPALLPAVSEAALVITFAGHPLTGWVSGEVTPRPLGPGDLVRVTEVPYEDEIGLVGQVAVVVHAILREGEWSGLVFVETPSGVRPGLGYGLVYEPDAQVSTALSDLAARGRATGFPVVYR